MTRRTLPLLVLTGFFAPAELPAAPTCALVVQVVDEAGNPAAGIPLHVKIGKDVENGATNATGAAEFGTLRCGEATIVAGPAAWDRPQGWAATTRMLRPEVPAVARLVVVARTEVTIRLLDARGRPVLSGVVSGSAIEGSGQLGSPDEKGIVKAWLQPGSWTLWWTGEPVGWNHALPGGWNYQYGGRVLAEIGREPKTVDLSIESRERLEGSVLDADGRPIAGVQLIARAPATGKLRGSAPTFADGRFVLDLWELPTDVEPVSFERALSFDPPRLTLAESPSAPVVFVGRPSTRPSLRGRVVRQGTGVAVPEASVVVFTECGESPPEGVALTDLAPIMAKSDANGGFEARCAPECPLRVSASLDGAGGSVQLPAGACDREAIVEIAKPKGWTLEGTVTDRKGVPLEGVPLSLARYAEKPGSPDARWIPLVHGHTGEGGRFRMEGGMGGRWRLEVARQGATKDLRDLVLVSKRSPGTRFELSLEPEDAKSVEVRAIPGATVCARALVENLPSTLSAFALYAEDEDVVVEQADNWEGGGRKDGRLCLEGIVPGRYRVRIGNPSRSIPSWYPGTEDRASALPLSVSSGMNDLEPIAVRAAGTLHLVLPGWAGQDPPTVEYRAPVPEDAAADAEPAPFTAVARDRVKSLEDHAALVTLPAGTWELRACARPRCEGEGATWRTAKPIEILRGQVTRAALDGDSHL